MSTLTEDETARIAAWLGEHPVLAVGVGTEEQACSVAAINLALTGELTDDIPECMSEVIGKWIIVVQDAMPADVRNSAEWRGLLPLAAGTGRGHEAERLNVILDWMHSVLARLQSFANKGGFGPEWASALEERTAADWDAAGAAAGAARAARAADCAARAAGAARAAAAGAAAEATRNAAGAAAWDAAWDAARDVGGAARAARAAAWGAFHRESDYPGLLRRLIEVSES